MNPSPISQILEYHDRTKHQGHRYARGPGYLDWANQPDPFRRYSGAPAIPLPPVVDDDSPPFAGIWKPGEVSPAALDADSVSRFMELSLAVSAWKQAGDSRWALRCNPSSGNLHPTEGYLLLPALPGGHPAPGVFHYQSEEHSLELRAEMETALWDRLVKPFPARTFLMGLSSIHWREAWKYGERAFRYCQHDIGHALAACRIAAATCGWRLILLEDVGDATIARLLGLDREPDFADAEREHPDLVAVVFPNSAPVSCVPLGLDSGAVEAVARGQWRGRANTLSESEIPWEAIQAASAITLKPEAKDKGTFPLAARASSVFVNPETSIRERAVTARQIIRQRRSAVNFDGVTSISSSRFFAMLSQTLAGKTGGPVPWDAVPWPSRIHLCLYVHRVRGLTPGIYFLVRDPSCLDRIRQKTRPAFAWQIPAGCPPDLPLYLLEPGEVTSHAASVSCGQAIAGDSAFSLGMIAEFEDPLNQYGSWYYRRLFWESGMVGQVLYMAAEYAGLRATGIGCYFDDAVHGRLGFPDRTFQSLYHFTVGGPVLDERLTTFPAYPWSCDLEAGRFPTRDGLADEGHPPPSHLKFQSQGIHSWKGKSLVRIGMRLHRLDPRRQEHREALGSALAGGLTIFEVSPDETGGEDESLLGETLNRIVEEDPDSAREIFVVVRSGFVDGPGLRRFQYMRSRKRFNHDCLRSESGREFGIDPDSVRDQLARSRRRLGVGGIDLFLLRFDPTLFAHADEETIFRRMGEVSEVLRKEGERGTLGAWGLALEDPRQVANSLYGTPFRRLLDRLVECPPFSALEVQANFIQDGPFREEAGCPSLVTFARERNLLILGGGALTATVDGGICLLTDFPPFGKQDPLQFQEEAMRWLREVEGEIYSLPTRDGRDFRQVMQEAHLPPAFHFSSLVERMGPPKAGAESASRQAEEILRNALERARFLGGQLARTGVVSGEKLNDLLECAGSVLSRVGHHYKLMSRDLDSGKIQDLRGRFFPSAGSEISLQSLALRWLLDRGVDVVLSSLRHPAYVEEALEILKGVPENAPKP